MKLSLLIITKLKQALLCSLLLGWTFSVVQAAERLPYYNSAEFTPNWLNNDDSKLANFHQIPDFNFVDQNGNEVSERTFEGKVYVAGFFFSTCPGICPAIRSKLIKVQEEYLENDNVKILQHSIRPTTDTVETLNKYAEVNGIVSSKWHLATGDKNAIYSLAKSAYFASDDLGNIQKTNDFLHTESLLLIDENRHIRGIYNGLNSASVDYLIADIETLLQE